MNRKLKKLYTRIARLRKTEPRSAMFPCQNLMMARHLEGAFLAAREHGGYQLYYTFRADLPERETQAIAKIFADAVHVPEAQAHRRRFELAFLADHDHYGELASLARAAIHTGHGSPSKSYKNDNDVPHEYSRKAREGRNWRYRWFLEASAHVRDHMVSAHPELSERIRVVGNHLDDQLLAQRAQRTGDQPFTVLVATTWGPDALFRRLGHDFALALIRAAMAEEGLRLVLSPHPKEFIPGNEATADWDRLRRLAEGSSVRFLEQGEDTLAVLASADALICDNTSVSHKAALLGMPIAMCEFDDCRVWKHGATRLIHQHGIRLDPRVEPRALLKQLRAAAAEDQQAMALSSVINSCPGHYRENMLAFLASLSDTSA